MVAADGNGMREDCRKADEVAFNHALLNQVSTEYRSHPALLARCAAKNLFFNFWFLGKTRKSVLLNVIIQVPLLVPLGLAYGINPIQLGIIFLANMELGYLTPPVGLNVYMSSYRFGRSVPAVFRAVLPIIIVLHIGVLLITYVPALTTTLPRWFAH